MGVAQGLSGDSSFPVDWIFLPMEVGDRPLCRVGLPEHGWIHVLTIAVALEARAEEVADVTVVVVMRMAVVAVKTVAAEEGVRLVVEAVMMVGAEGGVGGAEMAAAAMTVAGTLTLVVATTVDAVAKMARSMAVFLSQVVSTHVAVR
jgi:hypothetical protein